MLVRDRVVVRFINEDGKIEEHAVDVVEAHDRSAQGLLELLTTCLASLGIPLDGIVSQCYNEGAQRWTPDIVISQVWTNCFVHSLFLPQITSRNHRYNHRLATITL